MPISSSQQGRELHAMRKVETRGRPKGVLTVDQKLKMKTQLEMNKLGYKRARKIINAQTIVALGTHKMIVIRKVEGKSVAVKINDEKEIDRLLAEGEYGKDYLVVVGTMPDAKAGNMILDRIYGKAKETIDLGVNVKFSLKELADTRRNELGENFEDDSNPVPAGSEESQTDSENNIENNIDEPLDTDEKIIDAEVKNP